ncbi:MAG: transglycosylase SLT domain-containing protein [Adhaeribacter sp.]
MKHHLSRLFPFLIFIAAPLSLAFGSPADPTRNKDIAAQKPLNDSVVASLPDTSFVLTLPLVVRQDSVPVIPNELVMDRLSCLQGTIPLHYNSYVQGFVNYFTIRNRKYTRRILERENVYFPLFEKYLAKHNLPQEFKYLAVVESALNPRAMSWAKAVGLWQFMSPTAGDFNLQITPFIDERMDPEKSTEAACKYLKQLYRIFGDWELVMAAYNCGPGNVKKAIARSGGKKNFWEIFPYLPKETRSYVPSFTAVVYTMNHALDHELVPDTLLYPIATDTLLISQSLDLSRLSQQLSLDSNYLQQLNPAVRKGVLPENIKKYPLKVPAQSRQLLAMNRTAILDSSRVPVLVKPIEPKVMLASASPVQKNAPALPADSTSADSLQQREYVVVKGDFLEKIARKNKVSIAQLQEWNNLSGTSLMPGQKLVIYTPVTGEAAEQTQVLAVNKTAEAAGPKASPAAGRKSRPAKVEEVELIHAVQPGDTLYNISRRYNNIPVERIKKLNKLKTDEIKPGQKLVIS